MNIDEHTCRSPSLLSGVNIVNVLFERIRNSMHSRERSRAFTCFVNNAELMTTEIDVHCGTVLLHTCVGTHQCVPFAIGVPNAETRALVRTVTRHRHSRLFPCK